MNIYRTKKEETKIHAQQHEQAESTAVQQAGGREKTKKNKYLFHFEMREREEYGREPREFMDQF